MKLQNERENAMNETEGSCRRVAEDVGNLLWLFTGGLPGAVLLFVQGVLWCVTILGIPVGLQLFKAAQLVVSPFGADVYRKEAADAPVGCMTGVLNVIWMLFGGLWNALVNLTWGVILCCTIVGIPFGLQYFKIAKLVLFPFGLEVRRSGGMGRSYALSVIVLAVYLLVLFRVVCGGFRVAASAY